MDLTAWKSYSDHLKIKKKFSHQGKPMFFTSWWFFWIIQTCGKTMDLNSRLDFQGLNEKPFPTRPAFVTWFPTRWVPTRSFIPGKPIRIFVHSNGGKPCNMFDDHISRKLTMVWIHNMFSFSLRFSWHIQLPWWYPGSQKQAFTKSTIFQLGKLNHPKLGAMILIVFDFQGVLRFSKKLTINFQPISTRHYGPNILRSIIFLNWNWFTPRTKKASTRRVKSMENNLINSEFLL